MATFTAGGNEGALNGTSEVTLVAAPGSGVSRLVKSLTIHQGDSASVTVYVSKKKGATKRRLYSLTLAVGSTWSDGTVRVLDATDESIVAEMSGAAATTNPSFDAAYGDYTA